MFRIIAVVAGRGVKVIMLIMIAHTLNDHLVIRTLVGEQVRRHGAVCRSGAFTVVKVRKVLMFWSFRCAP